MPYVEYLQTPEWRKRRDTSIRLAGHQCKRCAKRGELQVHHLTYARLGEEWDTDLEVLCRGCHEGHHHEESRQQHLGIYIKLVSEVLKAEGFSNIADLSAAVKDKCGALKIPCRHDRVPLALEAVSSNRLPLARGAKPVEVDDTPDQPIGRDEAAEICRRLKLLVPFRDIPSVRKTTPFASDRVKAAQMVAAEILASVERCEALEADKS